MQEETIRVKIVLENQYKVDVGQNIDDVQLLMAKGDKGDKGDTGPANTLAIGTVAKGDNAAATITGTAPNQTLNLTLPKGDKGDKGNTGDTGATGPANTLSIGTVTKGNDAAATITGTAPNQTLNLTLPKGDKGDKGDTGDTGATGASGLGALTLSTTDIGEGVTLAANTLYGVYE